MTKRVTTSEPSDPLTTAEKLGEAQDHFELTEEQARILAAKEGLVRSLEDERPGELVLKGGTLLHHGYGSPRVSILDVDYAAPSADSELNAAKVAEMASIDRMETQGFRIKAYEGTWSAEAGLVHADDVPFELHVGEANGSGPLSISVSVRQAEVLDGIHPVEFRAVAVTGLVVARVSGVSLAEASVEKVIGYCLKGKSKHLADLAWLARDHPELADRGDDIRGMLVEKVRQELAADATKGMYEELRVEDVPGLLAYLDREKRRKSLRRKWSGEVQAELLLDPGERDQEEGLTDIEWVLAQIDGFWLDILGPIRR